MKIQELLEAVGGDYIYHSVANDRTAIKILRTGVINPNLSDEDEEYIQNPPGKDWDMVYRTNSK